MEVVVALYGHIEERDGEQGMIDSAMVITGAGRGR